MHLQIWKHIYGFGVIQIWYGTRLVIRPLWCSYHRTIWLLFSISSLQREMARAKRGWSAAYPWACISRAEATWFADCQKLAVIKVPTGAYVASQIRSVVVVLEAALFLFEMNQQQVVLKATKIKITYNWWHWSNTYFLASILRPYSCIVTLWELRLLGSWKKNVANECVYLKDNQIWERIKFLECTVCCWLF